MYYTYYPVLFNHIRVLIRLFNLWQIQGAIMVTSLVQIALSFSGALGLLLRFIGPLVIGPTLITLGLSLYAPSARFSSANWGVAVLYVQSFTSTPKYQSPF